MKVKKFFHEANTLFGQSFCIREESKTEALKRFIDEITCKKNSILQEIRSNQITFSKQVKLEEELSICILQIEKGKKLLEKKLLKQDAFYEEMYK